MILRFVYYSIIGWILEVSHAFYKERKFVNRGFLTGPVCPMYGFAGVSLVLLKPNMNIFSVFLFSVLACFIVEYITSFTMEKLFKLRWWDYSNEKFNIKGRVCIKYLILFGLCGVGFYYFLNPLFEYLYGFITYPNIISIIIVTVMIIDFIFSSYTTIKVNHNIKDHKLDNTTYVLKSKLKILKKIFNK